MSDGWTFGYRIEGDPSVLAKARQSIDIHREQRGDDNGLRFRVRKNLDGSLGWRGSAVGGIVFLVDHELMNLTQGNAARVWAYKGEDNDDFIRSWLLRLEAGEGRLIASWDDDVGFVAAMAAADLDGSANVRADLVLLAALDAAGRRPSRCSAVLARAMLEALHRHPELTSSDAIWPRVLKIRSQIAAGSIASKTAGGDHEGMDPRRNDRLFADIEAGILAKGLRAPTRQPCQPNAARL